MEQQKEELLVDGNDAATSVAELSADVSNTNGEHNSHPQSEPAFEPAPAEEAQAHINSLSASATSPTEESLDSLDQISADPAAKKADPTDEELTQEEVQASDDAVGEETNGTDGTSATVPEEETVMTATAADGAGEDEAPVENPVLEESELAQPIVEVEGNGDSVASEENPVEPVSSVENRVNEELVPEELVPEEETVATVTAADGAGEDEAPVENPVLDESELTQPVVVAEGDGDSVASEEEKPTEVEADTSAQVTENPVEEIPGENSVVLDEPESSPLVAEAENDSVASMEEKTDEAISSVENQADKELTQSNTDSVAEEKVVAAATVEDGIGEASVEDPVVLDESELTQPIVEAEGNGDSIASEEKPAEPVTLAAGDSVAPEEDKPEKDKPEEDKVDEPVVSAVDQVKEELAQADADLVTEKPIAESVEADTSASAAENPVEEMPVEKPVEVNEPKPSVPVAEAEQASVVPSVLPNGNPVVEEPVQAQSVAATPIVKNTARNLFEDDEFEEGDPTDTNQSQIGAKAAKPIASNRTPAPSAAAVAPVFGTDLILNASSRGAGANGLVSSARGSQAFRGSIRRSINLGSPPNGSTQPEEPKKISSISIVLDDRVPEQDKIQDLRGIINFALLGTRQVNDPKNQKPEEVDNGAGGLCSDGYIGWMQDTGLSRFSHWHHRSGGVKNARELLVKVNDPTIDLKGVCEALIKAINYSGNHQHSMSRDVIANIKLDGDIYTMSSKDFAKAKESFVDLLESIIQGLSKAPINSKTK